MNTYRLFIFFLVKLQIISFSLIQLNSSIQQIPPSLNGNAPASSEYSEDESLTTEAVNPADVDPVPVVKTDLRTNLHAHFSIFDFPVPGSPTIIICDSQRVRVPVCESIKGTPPIIDNNTANFI